MDVDILTGLNPEQRHAAIRSDDPLLIVAGAGTGKTRTLTHRVGHLIAQGVDPGRILLLTFTRRAAREMMRRVEVLMRDLDTSRSDGRTSGSRLWGGTFHSVSARLLRIHGREIGLDPDFTILDRGDAEDLMHLTRAELGLSSTARRFPQKGTCLDIYSRCVNARESLTEVLATRFPWCSDHEDDLKRLFGEYTDRKEATHVLDYDDLLLFWHGLLSDPIAGETVRRRFDHVLVDEYQDTNVLQAEILSALRPDGVGLTAVGDDAQAIYSFRAATVRNILDFEQRFPKAEVVHLETNYRSTPELVQATNTIIAEATERRDKTLRPDRPHGPRPTVACCQDETEQTDYVISRVLGHRERGIMLRDQAVLFRAAHHSAELELELARRNIPFVKYGGLRFVEMAHVKDLAAFLRLAENPRDRVSGMRLLGLLPGVGPGTASKLLDALERGSYDFDAWVNTKVPSAAAGAWPDLVSVLRSLASADGDLPAQVHAARTVYAPLLGLRYDNVDARLRDLEHIEGLASRYPDRQRLLTEIVLDPPAYTGDLAGPPLLDEDFLILSTMHSAKGLEWDVVHVIHAADGNIPSDMATGSAEEIEEERRLFYVACTRARDDLHVVYPVRYYTHSRGFTDTHGYAQRTRFVSAEVAHSFDRVFTGPTDSIETELASPTTTAASVRSKVRAMWD